MEKYNFFEKKIIKTATFYMFMTVFAGDTLDKTKRRFTRPTNGAVTLATGTPQELTCARISSVADQCVHPTILSRAEQVQFKMCTCVSNIMHVLEV